MEIKIKDAAKEYLENKITSNDIVLLALDDGSNKFSNLGGSCTIGSKFQFVVTDKMEPEFDQPLENNLGLKLYTGKPELMYLIDGLNVDYRMGFLSLSDNSGIIDGAVSVTKYEAPTDAEVEEQMKTLGNKIC
ncbi:iron-sulfur cluster biosynthesis family protein [Lapidilactobacillus mulanensis]|uniref:Iron-sulfur cluster biosynthesis family protein n=1 Tax=Lapidilactobacillus mulanensis TaxID=2485999 RepID=A0ABW4DP91_9LACO|nr:iron-sulfur cluster biosynthesis family protein [Lapidilactobacillus mulanensis]